MASIYSKREQYAQALEYALQALQTDKSVENSLGIAQDLLALGIISSKLARDTEAFDYLERSYGIYSALSYTSGLWSVLPQLVETGRRIGRATEAAAYAAQLEALDRQ
jgi:tetratricopeptide (TPR) repeat protein